MRKQAHPEEHALQRTARSRWKLGLRRAGTLAATTLAVVMAYGVVFGHNGLTAFAKKRKEAGALEQQTLRLQQENDRLRGHVARLKDDPGEIEHQARANLRYTRPDEVVVTVPTEKTVSRE